MEAFLMAAEEQKVVLQSEFNVIGCLLVDTDNTLKMIRGIITPDDFQNETCQSLYRAALDLAADNQPLDHILIEKRAIELGLQIDADTSREIKQCFTTTANVTLHAAKILEAAQKRKGAAVGLELTEYSIPILDAIGKLQEILNREKRAAGRPEDMANELADYLFHEDKEPPFLSTGYNNLDGILGGGFVHGGLYTFAARTNVGKSNIAINISEKIAARGKTVLYFSFEMPKTDINIRRIGIISGISTGDIKSKRFLKNQEKPARIMQTLDTISKRPFLIYDLPGTLDDIETEIRSHEQLDLIVIDHIGIISEPEGAGRYSQYQFMTGISHRLKRIALSTRVPILALCQLNRETEKRQDKEPILSDLRDSGSIEEDSDSVILLYRPSIYLSEDSRPKPTEPDDIYCLVKKNRHGALGTAIVKFYGENSRIIEEVKFR